MHDEWERRFGVGTCPHGKLAKALGPLAHHHDGETIAAHLGVYLAKQEVRFYNFFTFASTFNAWAPTPPPGPAVEEGWMTDAFERDTRP